MPIGIFLINHHETRGPEIKLSYFKRNIHLPQEFITQLYMAHAGLSKNDNIEMNFQENRVLSCFTGNKDRKLNEEGILGIIFEYKEDTREISLFMNRYMEYIINNQNEDTLKDIILSKLQIYQNLIKFFKSYKIQNIEEILLIGGNDTYTKTFLSNTEKNKNFSQLSQLFEKLVNNNKLNNYIHQNVGKMHGIDVYFLIKYQGAQKKIKEIFNFICPFIKKHLNYALEILLLIFTPHLITSQKMSEYSDNKKKKKISILRKLGKRNRYRSAFLNILANIIVDEEIITPLI